MQSHLPTINQSSSTYEVVMHDYLNKNEKAAQYPRPTELLGSTKEDPSNAVLKKLFIEHQDRFDQEYKKKLFEIG